MAISNLSNLTMLEFSNTHIKDRLLSLTLCCGLRCGLGRSRWSKIPRLRGLALLDKWRISAGRTRRTAHRLMRVRSCDGGISKESIGAVNCPWSNSYRLMELDGAILTLLRMHLIHHLSVAHVALAARVLLLFDVNISCLTLFRIHSLARCGGIAAWVMRTRWWRLRSVPSRRTLP